MKSFFETRKDYKNIFLTKCKNYEYLYLAVVIQYVKANCDVILATIATLGLHKKIKISVFGNTLLLF